MNILIVDDILINRVILSQFVTKLGYSCSLAQNGKEAIELLQTQTFDLVMMDIEMPVMNGIEAVRKIRLSPSPVAEIPVIALTAHNADDFFDEYGNVGFNELVSKPYLLEKIERVIAKVTQK